MPKKVTTQEYFELIKHNHKLFLEQNMVTHLELIGGVKQAKLVGKYNSHLGLYRPEKERYLTRAIQQPSTASKIEHGALAALLGIGVGGLAFYAQQNTGVLNALNPLGVAQNVAAGAFSTVLGAGATYVIYNAWHAYAKNEAADDFEKCQTGMQAAGFTNEKYAELSEGLVKLFHFRECLLLNLKDNRGAYIRDEFKKKYAPDNEPVDEAALNIAIELYFLQQLNILFNESFKKIYEIQEQEIGDEIQQNAFLTWLKSYFEKEGEREKFTQQMQIEFMNQCLDYLEKEMMEPGFLAQYPYASMAVSGLIASLVVLALSAAIIGGPITMGIASIALVMGCISAATMYWALNNVDTVQYKRNKGNRESIAQTINDVTKESQRLGRLIQNVTETTAEDIKLLAKYRDDEGGTRGFLAYFNLFHQQKTVALGASTAWVREYAARYRHSKAIEIDLSVQQRGIIDRGHIQTEEMQHLLLQYMSSKQHIPAALKKFIDDTTEYLNDPIHRLFITRFELIEKIKQQVLDIVAVAPRDSEWELPNERLPVELVNFYTQPVSAGGLGGVAADLVMARSLAPVVAANVALDEDHPYSRLLVTAQRMNYALSQDKSREFILLGDSSYRRMLGLRTESLSERVDNKIDSGNIQRYLTDSFDFLYSLNKSIAIEDAQTYLDTPFANSKEFMLYRTLLIKQLAILADPTNTRVEESVRKDIEKFAREKLQIEPLVVFDDIRNQSLFERREIDGPSIVDPLGIAQPVSNLEYVTDAIRLDLAYVSRSITPRMLIAFEANEFVMDNGHTEKTMFCYQNSKTELIPETTEAYVEKIRFTIEMTKEFIKQMADKNVLKKSGALLGYVHDCKQEIKTLRAQIKCLDMRLPHKENQAFNSTILDVADSLLQEYQSELRVMLGPKPESSLQSSIIQFALFGRREPIDLNSFDEWEVVQDDKAEAESPKALIATPAVIERVINAMEAYIKSRLNQPDVSRFNFFSYTKADKTKAATELMDAATLLKEHKLVDLAFLANKIYQNGELGAAITGLLKEVGVHTLQELLVLPAVLPQSP